MPAARVTTSTRIPAASLPVSHVALHRVGVNVGTPAPDRARWTISKTACWPFGTVTG